MFRQFALVALILFSVAAFAGCKGGFSPSAALDAGSDLYKAAAISDEEVAELSKKSVAQYDAQSTVASASDKYTKRLMGIVGGLVNEDGLNLNFKVHKTPDVNACAFPDGSVRVNSGLMDLMTDDEIYFVLGHEIGHVKLGHSAKGMRVAYAASAARKGASAAGGVAAAISASELGALSEAFVNAQFSQSQESDSDEYGLNLMKKYGKDTSSAVSALRKLASLGPASSGMASMFSSHPDSSARADKIEKLRNK